MSSPVCCPRAFRPSRSRSTRPRELPPQAGRPRALSLPPRPAQPQRDALLPAAAGEPHRDATDRLHPDGRAGVPAALAHHAAPARASTSTPTTSPTSTDLPGNVPLPAGPAHRRHRRRAHPRPRRPRRRRHGHPGRQGQPLRRGRRASTRRAACRSASTSAPTTSGCSNDPLYLGTGNPASTGARLRPLRRALRARRQAELPRRADSVGGLRQAQRVHAARALPRAGPILRRRHPGHGRDGLCHPARRDARQARLASPTSAS